MYGVNPIDTEGSWPEKPANCIFMAKIDWSKWIFVRWDLELGTLLYPKELVKKQITYQFS